MIVIVELRVWNDCHYRVDGLLYNLAWYDTVECIIIVEATALSSIFMSENNNERTFVVDVVSWKIQIFQFRIVSKNHRDSCVCDSAAFQVEVLQSGQRGHRTIVHVDFIGAQCNQLGQLQTWINYTHNVINNVVSVENMIYFSQVGQVCRYSYTN